MMGPLCIPFVSLLQVGHEATNLPQRRNAKELTWWYDCHRHTRPQEISAGSHDRWDGCNLTEPANGFSKKQEEKLKLLVNEGCALFEETNENYYCEKTQLHGAPTCLHAYIEL